jgi:hypothetical protein
MKFYSLILLFASTLLLFSCTPEHNKNDKAASKVELKPVTINGEYKMDVPAFMSKATTLNEAASLQYQNIFKEAYVIVIDEEKDAFIQAYKDLSAYDTARSVISNYTDTQIQSTTSELDVISQTEIKNFKVNGLNASSIEIDANLEGVQTPITYFLSFIEGQKKLYFVMAWTLQDKKEKHRETFQEMVKTFRVFKKKDN